MYDWGFFQSARSLNDVIRGKALKSVSFVLSEFSQTANIEPKLTTYVGTKGVSHKVKLLPQCFSVNDDTCTSYKTGPKL